MSGSLTSGFTFGGMSHRPFGWSCLIDMETLVDFFMTSRGITVNLVSHGQQLGSNFLGLTSLLTRPDTIILQSSSCSKTESTLSQTVPDLDFSPFLL